MHIKTHGYVHTLVRLKFHAFPLLSAVYTHIQKLCIYISVIGFKRHEAFKDSYSWNIAKLSVDMDLCAIKCLQSIDCVGFVYSPSIDVQCYLKSKTDFRLNENEYNKKLHIWAIYYINHT